MPQLLDPPTRCRPRRLDAHRTEAEGHTTSHCLLPRRDSLSIGHAPRISSPTSAPNVGSFHADSCGRRTGMNGGIIPGLLPEPYHQQLRTRGLVRGLPRRHDGAAAKGARAPSRPCPRARGALLHRARQPQARACGAIDWSPYRHDGEAAIDVTPLDVSQKQQVTHSPRRPGLLRNIPDPRQRAAPPSALPRLRDSAIPAS